MKRYEILALTGAGATKADAIRPNLTGAWALLASRAGRALVKRDVPDGTAATAGTVADLPTGAANVTATALSAGERTTIASFLTAQGLDASQFAGDGVTDRRAYLRYVLRRAFLVPELDGPQAITGFDAA